MAGAIRKAEELKAADPEGVFIPSNFLTRPTRRPIVGPRPRKSSRATEAIWTPLSLESGLAAP